MTLFDYIEPTNARELSQSLSNFCIKNGATNKDSKNVRVQITDSGLIQLSWDPNITKGDSPPVKETTSEKVIA